MASNNNPNNIRTSNQRSCKENIISSSLSKYRSFLQNHRFTLHLVEDLLSRLVLYAPSRFHHTNGDNNADGDDAAHESEGNHDVLPETLYGILNLWSLLNDVLCHGLGNDNGLTVGVLSSSSSSTDPIDNTSLEEIKTSKKDQTITILRSILTVIDCIAPALEVRAHYHQRNNSKQSHKQRGRQSNQHSLLDMLALIEKIKFVCRLSILALNYASCFHDKDDTIDSQNRSHPSYIKQDSKHRNDEDSLIQMSSISSFGILKDGGMLDLGCDDAISVENERKRIKRLLYVGKRTGRKLYNHDCNQKCTNELNNMNDDADDGGVKGSSHLLSKWKDLVQSPKVKIGLIVLGEILHLVRPLYHIHAIRSCESTIGYGHDDTATNKNHTKDEKMTYRRRMMMKIWLKSFLIDLISLKSIEMGHKVKKKLSPNGIISEVDVSSQALRDELYNRKMRLMLYALRAPFYHDLTFPVTQRVASIVDCIPLVGQPVSTYLLDILAYWQQWHFMMER